MTKKTVEIAPIAHIRTDFPDKFGIPRQSGLVETEAEIVFEEPFRDVSAVRGLDDFSHIWLIWQFSASVRDTWSPTVRPPRLGGNERVGVFATRSPFRPNALGLSSVRLLGIDRDAKDGPILRVAGADLMDGTPIFDIKPYLPYTDAHPEARSSFAAQPGEGALTVDFPPELLARIPEEKRAPLIAVLAEDPRPGYQHEDGRVYGLSFAGFDVHFTVADRRAVVSDVYEK